ncbi:MAG: hypothetical protein PHD95_03460 [Candidatus ainarchaeum sp.]|nr:hypothetical protein [Candidatus ainarchaeum sp.]
MQTRKPTPRETRERIIENRAARGRRKAVFFEPSPNTLDYLGQVAEAVNAKYTLPALRRRVDTSFVDLLEKAEKPGAKIICNELLKTVLQKELQANAKFALAEKTILRIFERTYRSHGEGRVTLNPAEQLFFKGMGPEIEGALNKLSIQCGEIGLRLILQSPSVRKHYILGTVRHLDKVLTEIMYAMEGV